MVTIIRKCPWVLYLRVESNLKPTVAVLGSFGFKRRDIKTLVQAAPSILVRTPSVTHTFSLAQ